MESYILVVEDEEPIRRFICINLTRAGFSVLEADTAEKGLQLLSHTPDVAAIILDVMLPGMDGFSFCQAIREAGYNPAIIMLTARGQDADKISGLEYGADDYITKPFNPLELIARLRAVLRRLNPNVQPAAEPIIAQGPFVFQPAARTIHKSGALLRLSQKEHALLTWFLRHPGHVFSRDELLDAVWGCDYFGDYKTVDVHMRRLREKIEEAPSTPRYLLTVWGLGYQFVPGERT
ncbi:response regulator transcription factor [Aneurinibacillus sp. Ricciae_BoGa-3]|nr:response regulator transcription factor [Aneurinibacillus sp. Ricciae_BoGa-3]WCK55184.1 response regulator transcription factor [Aneurinibacillus sp. Ricciae_BoGa-3]